MKFSFHAVALVALLAVAGCNSTPGNKTGGVTGPDGSENVSVSASAVPVVAEAKLPAEHLALKNDNPIDTEPNFPDLAEEFGGRDSLEGFNRSMFAVNKFGLRYIVQPFVIFWGSLIPKHGIVCINRCTNNIAFPKRTFSSLCQAKFKYAGIDTSRFLINVTLGVAGFYDPAFDWFDLEEQDEDFGQAFAVWGIGPGPVLHLPVLGQSNLRDGIGKIFDYAFDPKTYVPYPGVFGFTVLNESAHRYRDMDTFYRANYDPYELLKRLYASERFIKINDYDRMLRFLEYQKKLVSDGQSEYHSISKPEPDPLLNEVVISGFETQGAHVDTLRVVMVSIQNENKSMWVDVSLWNTDFFNQGSIRSVEVIKGKPDMPYKVWYQKQDDAPIAVVIPGFGSHFTGTHISAISEILFNQGYTVVALNNAFNWEFMSTASSVPVPGYIPSDAEDVRDAISAVFKDLENKGLRFQKRILVGYSLGGMHALFIGAKEKAEPKLKIDQFVAINPPVDAVKAVSALDGIGHAWKKWPREQVFERGSFAACKYISMSKKQYKPYGETEKENARYEPLPFSDIEAQALISFNYKITLDEMILSIVRNNGDMNFFKSPCSWGNRTDFYREINQLSFADYHEMFLLKYRSGIEKCTLSADELNEKSSLSSIEDFLRNDRNAFIIHSSNDFLESPAERQWLRKTMGDRCVFYNVGGHLGDLYLAGLQSKLATIACDLKKQMNSPGVAGQEIAKGVPEKNK